ncbi:hypothetical protein NRB56_35210 [Nocardia sp. RB56]|uniref:Uncharacterized protein n=1 Tax=Nocardia aurantia TaxID=2585199 RepID=A0A7K0DQS2_9NOCA|nr:hypothetical protein [Nocardia aurantia]
MGVPARFVPVGSNAQRPVRSTALVMTVVAGRPAPALR